MSQIIFSSSCSYTNHNYEEHWTWPTVKPGVYLCWLPYGCGEDTSVGILVGYLGFLPVSLFGLAWVFFQHHCTTDLCRLVWKFCVILALNQNQYFSRGKWCKMVNSVFPQTKFIILLQASFPFLTHPRSPFLLTHLLNLNQLFPFLDLSADSFPFQVGPATQQSPSSHPGI